MPLSASQFTLSLWSTAVDLFSSRRYTRCSLCKVSRVNLTYICVFLQVTKVLGRTGSQGQCTQVGPANVSVTMQLLCKEVLFKPVFGYSLPNTSEIKRYIRKYLNFVDEVVRFYVSSLHVCVCLVSPGSKTLIVYCGKKSKQSQFNSIKCDFCNSVYILNQDCLTSVNVRVASNFVPDFTCYHI